ncbi:MAG: ABC transporter permease subunit [Desulfobacteraceae bacterium]|nr:ABC transporter permease subunit [Desulfobacteraceae bacterium]
MAVKENISKLVFWGASLLSLGITLGILGFMVILAYPIFARGLFWDMLIGPWSPDQGLFGIGPMIAGTMSIAFLAVGISFPISLGVSSFVGILHPRGKGKILKGMVEAMTAVPTVIYGFVGIFLLVPLVRELFSRGSGMCILSAGIMLGILISPTMILFFTQSFTMVPKSYLNAAEALGANRVQKFFYIVLPFAWRSMVTGLILSFGRAMGDTLIALMISGNAVGFPGSILDSARTLTAHIALIIAADFDSIEFKTIFICGISLYAMTGIMVSLTRFLSRKGRV